MTDKINEDILEIKNALNNLQKQFIVLNNNFFKLKNGLNAELVEKLKNKVNKMDAILDDVKYVSEKLSGLRDFLSDYCDPDWD